MVHFWVISISEIWPEVSALTPEVLFFETHLSFELSEGMVCCCQILRKLCKMWHNSWMPGLKGLDHRWYRLDRKGTGSWSRFCFWWASRAWWNSWWWVVTTSGRSNMLSRFLAITIAISKKIWNWKTEIWFLWFAWWSINYFNINLNFIFYNFPSKRSI